MKLEICFYFSRKSSNPQNQGIFEMAAIGRAILQWTNLKLQSIDENLKFFQKCLPDKKDGREKNWSFHFL